jgi:aspartate/methionine/tyrosine aminotransferase
LLVFLDSGLFYSRGVIVVSDSRLSEKKEVGVKSLRPFGTSIFTETTNLANANGAVNLSQGFPDFEGPKEVRARAVRMSHQFITFCGQSALQEGVALGIDSSESYYELFLADYTTKRNLLCEGLRQLGFQVFAPEGTYYTLVDIRSLGFQDDVAFCKMLPQNAGVAAIPCSAFYFSNNPARHLARFAFCKKDETLHVALRRLRAWKATLKG